MTTLLAFLLSFALGTEPVDSAPESNRPDPATTWPIRFEGQCQPTDPHFDLEILYTEGQYAEGLRIADERLAKSPDDVVLHWMKVRFMYEVGERFGEDSDVDRIAHYRKMIAIAERGLQLDPNETHLRFGRGVAKGRLGTTRGVLASLFLAKEVEADWLAVAEHPTWRYASIKGGELLPCDAFHALGIFYRLVPDWWIVQVIAGTRGSLPRSLEFNTKAVGCKPHMVQNWKELAAVQYCLYTKNGDESMRAAGDRSVTEGLKLPIRHDVDAIDHRHLNRLRDDPTLGCGYSRDGQQELDEKQLESPKAP